MEDVEVNAMKVLDESNYERDGTVSRWRVYRFYLGKHGPFTVRVPLTNFDLTEIDRRVQELQAHLRTLPG